MKNASRDAAAAAATKLLATTAGVFWFRVAPAGRATDGIMKIHDPDDAIRLYALLLVSRTAGELT